MVTSLEPPGHWCLRPPRRRRSSFRKGCSQAPTRSDRSAGSSGCRSFWIGLMVFCAVFASAPAAAGPARAARRQTAFGTEPASHHGHRRRRPRPVQPGRQRRPHLDARRVGVGAERHAGRRHDRSRLRLPPRQGLGFPHVVHRRAARVPGTRLRAGVGVLRRPQAQQRADRSSPCSPSPGTREWRGRSP